MRPFGHKFQCIVLDRHRALQLLPTAHSQPNYICKHHLCPAIVPGFFLRSFQSWPAEQRPHISAALAASLADKPRGSMSENQTVTP
jgi:hypothetical protein